MRAYELVAGASLLLIVSTGADAQETPGEPVPVQAAEPPAPNDAEIVVTALRRSERLQDVPASISALTADDLVNNRVQGVNDIVGPVPSLRANNIVGADTPIFALRGVSQFDYSVNQQGPVATYFDEVYKGSFPLLGVATYDMERVEVLRGPQGTLYGKNTTGGAINFISRRPSTSGLDGYLRAGIGNYDARELEGAINIPLGDNIASRTAFTLLRVGGWFENVLPGRPAGNERRQFAARQSILFRPSDQLTVILRAQTSLQNPVTYGILSLPSEDGVGLGLYEATGTGSSYFRQGLGRRQHASGYVERFRRRTAGAAINATYELTDQLSITSITSYDFGKVFIPEDLDASPLQVFDDNVTGRSKQISQDLRITRESRSGLNFILGAFASRETIRGQASYDYYLDLDVNGDGGVDSADCAETLFLACNYRNSYRQVKTTLAVYSDLFQEIGGEVTLRGGLRFTRDHGDLYDYRAQVFGPDGAPIANTIPGSGGFDATTSLSYRTSAVTGKLGIDYRIAPDSLLYFSASRGFRGPAFNSQAFFSSTELGTARAETVNAIEAGLKSQLFDRALTLNASAFYYDYRNQQAINITPEGVQTVINIPKSRIFGGELEARYRGIDGIELFASAGFLNTRIRKGTLGGVDLAGNQLPNAPKLSASVGGDFELFPLGNGMVSASPRVDYTSTQYFELLNAPNLRQGRFALLSGTLVAKDVLAGTTISLWVKNATNKCYYTSAVDGVSGFGFVAYHLGDPRTFGLTISKDF